MRALVALVCAAFAAAPAGDTEQIRQALRDVQPGPGWIYNDLAAGFAEAKRTGKPLLVVFR